MWQNLMTGGRNRHASAVLQVAMVGTVYISICIWYKNMQILLCEECSETRLVAEMRIDAIETTADDTLTPVHPYQFYLKMVICLSANALLQV